MTATDGSAPQPALKALTAASVSAASIASGGESLGSMTRPPTVSTRWQRRPDLRAWTYAR